jgi:hypothetical protein
MTWTRIITFITILSALVSCSSIKKQTTATASQEDYEVALQRRIEWLNASSGGYR